MSHRVETELKIDASADVVWQILTDFARYREWNTMMPHVAGEKTLGGVLDVRVKLGKRPAVNFKTRLIEFAAPRALCWRGGFAIRGLASGEHGFYLDPLVGGGVQLLHCETFRGLAVPLLFPLMHRELKSSFESMNQALKRRAEAQVT